jgi:hypothetical protein
MKTCTNCNIEKDESQFRVYKTYIAGLCIDCENEYRREWRRSRQKDNKYYERERLLKEEKNRCVRCEQIKPLSEFNKSNHVKTGYHNTCKDCQAVRERASKVKRMYNVTLDEINQRLKDSDWKCAICGCNLKGINHYVDHDHDTGKTRDILCVSCNGGIGFLKDDPDIILKSLLYLKSHGKIITDHLKLRELLED